MMAAVRIFIWLPVRLVRRSRISNMAFPLGACSFFLAGVAPAPSRWRKRYAPDAANGSPSKRRAHLRHDARRRPVPADRGLVRVHSEGGWRPIYLTFGANLAQREVIKAGRSWKKNESTDGPKSTNLPMCRRAVPS